MGQNLTSFNAILTSSGARLVSLSSPKNTWFVSPQGSDSLGGIAKTTPFKTIAKAIAACGSGDTIALLPGSYAEAVVLARSAGGLDGITIIGLGNKGDVGISPAPTNANALTNDIDDLTLINVDLNGKGTGTALVNTGDRLRAYNCKFENDDGTGLCALMTLQTIAQRAAHTKGNGADCRFEDCEFAWAASGINISGTDQGSVTELQVVRCWFHDLDTNHIYETVGSGGSAASTYASLLLDGNRHGTDEAGTLPAKFILLNADNANTGLMVNSAFPEAINGGKVLLSTHLIAVGCPFTGGINAAQPS